MNDFLKFLKEAIVEDDFEPRRAEETERVVNAQFRTRRRTVRWMSLLGTGFMSLVAITAVVLFVRTDPGASAKLLLGDVALFLFAMMAISFIKMWFAMMHNHLQLMHELKLIQVQLAHQNDPDTER